MLNYMCVGTKYFAFFIHATYINSLSYYIISVLRYLLPFRLSFKREFLLLPRVIKIRNYYGFDKHPQLFQALCI